MNQKPKRRFAVGGGVLVALAAVAGAAAAEEINREFHETFDVEPGAVLKLVHGDGEVNISPWNQDKLDVQVRYRAKSRTVVGWSKKTEIDVSFRQDGNTIYVVGKEPSMVSIGVSSYQEHEYTYTVQAPSYLQLELVGEDGDVSIEGWKAEIDLRSEDGDMRLVSIEAPRAEISVEDGDLEILGFAGDLSIDSEDGDVEIHDCAGANKIRLEDGDLDLFECSGDFDVVTADGNIRMSRLKAENVEVQVSDGDIDLELLSSDQLNLLMRAGDGNVDVELDPKISATFDLQTRDGRIRVHSKSVSDLREERRRTTGRFGDGGGNIEITTSDGDITVRH